MLSSQVTLSRDDPQEACEGQMDVLLDIDDCSASMMTGKQVSEEEKMWGKRLIIGVKLSNCKLVD